MENLVTSYLTPENIGIIGILLVAVVALWKVTQHYHKRSLEEAEQARQREQDVNDEHKDLLKRNNELQLAANRVLQERLDETQQQMREIAVNYEVRLAEIAGDYKATVGSFSETLTNVNSTLLGMQDVLKEQSKSLKSMSDLPQKVEQIQIDINYLKEAVFNGSTD